ncbi:MAG: hypothetical protein GEU99_23445 [Luteitalea sp.]|nr:hypothetical protein [Luteitalea sp.]
MWRYHTCGRISALSTLLLLSSAAGVGAFYCPNIVYDALRHGQEQLRIAYAELQRAQAELARSYWADIVHWIPEGGQIRYRTPDLNPRAHRTDPDPFGDYERFRDAIENGDPNGSGYQQIAGELPLPPSELFQAAHPDARRALIDATTLALMIDGYEIVGTHALGYHRDVLGQANAAIDNLQEDFMAHRTGNIEMLQLLLGAELLNAKATTPRNVSLYYLLRSELVDQKAARDATARAITTDIARARRLHDLDLITAGDGARTVYRLP